MNVILQRHCAKLIYVVPDGLRELMSDISREVIRKQPKNIYSFIADYLDALFITRENARIAKSLIDNVCEIAESIGEILLRMGLPLEGADIMASTIQKTFRDYLERQKTPTVEEIPDKCFEVTELIDEVMRQIGIPLQKSDEIAIIIKDAFIKFKERVAREKSNLSGFVEWRRAAGKAIALYKRTGVSEVEANRAAALIQAAYKGYFTRKNIHRILQISRLESEIEETVEERPYSYEEGLESKTESEFEAYEGILTEDETEVSRYYGFAKDELMGEGQCLVYSADFEETYLKCESEIETHASELFMGESNETESAIGDSSEFDGKHPPPNSEEDEQMIEEQSELEFGAYEPNQEVQLENEEVEEAYTVEQPPESNDDEDDTDVDEN